ncbi:MAG: tRNA pseudouridine(38-40) synthase TruA [Bacteroidetes bacterium]|nr:tRNA pseudouridine(38-40) synthase TruA [Bacteroidota bacterium]
MQKYFRYFIQLSYNGTGFCGWQFQPGVPTIQETLQEKMSLLLREKTVVVGCGRTDSGVHAKKYFAHFDCAQEGIENDEKIIFRLNKMLPPGIAIQKIFRMPDNAHARFAATSRSYEYHISQVKDPFGANFSWELHEELNFEKMNEGAKIIMGYDDFSAFSKTGSDNKTTFCKVTFSEWEKTETGIVYFISANRFLRNMVRAIAGTLTDMGRGKISAGEFKKIIESGDRSEASMSVPPGGLFLTDVKYPLEFGLEPEKMQKAENRKQKTENRS